MTKKNKILRIGIDFDNTIACYDKVFCELAKSWLLVDPCFQGTKSQLRDTVCALPDGDLIWQRLQGKAYGEFMHSAECFGGIHEFITTCNRYPFVELFIVSHKTEYGHFDEKKVNLRDAARTWLYKQGFLNGACPAIKEHNVFFETSREEKIERIRSLHCTHFIDDLVEVLNSPLFPTTTQRILFQPGYDDKQLNLLQDTNEEKSFHRSTYELKHYSNWTTIKNAFFS